MAQKWWPASALTGGGEGALDAIDGSYLTDGDRAIVIASDTLYFYLLDADSADAESSPDIIAPDTNAGDKRWILIQVVPGHIWTVFSNRAPAILSRVVGSTDSFATGYNCKVQGSDLSIIVLGSNDEILESDWSCIGGPAQHKILGGGSHFIAGGITDLISGDSWNSSILGGHLNRIFGDASFIGGGDFNDCNRDYCGVVGGEYGRAYLDHQIATGYGYFNRFSITGGYSPSGDAQSSYLGRKIETTGATPTVMATDIRPVGQRVWQFKISVVATQTAGSAGTVGDSAFWNITGGVKSIGGTAAKGTITLSGNRAAGDTINVCGTEFTFVDSSDLGLREIPVDEIHYGFKEIFGLNLNEFYASTPSWGVIEITSKDHKASDNSLTFSESSTGLSMDGSGTFGGTTAGVDGTVALVGTVQGDGVPGANDRDTGAAAWDCTVTANDTDKRLDITVTGEVDKTIHWVAKVELVEVG